jgi:hypothetical protein
LVERLVRNEKVRSSSLLGSTSFFARVFNFFNKQISIVKYFALFSLAIVSGLLAGCTHFKSKPTPAPAAHAAIIVTPDNSLDGKVISYDSVGRFVVLNFPSREMPQIDQRLFLYRAGLKVAEIKVSGPQEEDNIVADLVNGDAQPGDEVRDK